MAVTSNTIANPSQETPMPSVLDSYLCKEPWERSGSLSPIDQSFFKFSDLDRLRSSLDFYSQKDRRKSVQYLQFEIAKLHLRDERWEDAYHVLLPLWRNSTWRRNGWWHLLSEVAWTLRECALRLKDYKTLLAVEWELLHKGDLKLLLLL